MLNTRTNEGCGAVECVGGFGQTVSGAFDRRNGNEMGSDEPSCVRGLQWRRYLDNTVDLHVQHVKILPPRGAPRGEAHCANVNNSSATPPPQISASAAPIHAALHLLARLITPPDRRAGAARTTPTSQPDRGVRRRNPAPPAANAPIFTIAPRTSKPAHSTALRLLSATNAARVHDSNASSACGVWRRDYE